MTGAATEPTNETPTNATDEVLGPIDFVALEFPGGRLAAAGFDQLLSLVDRGVIGILDVEFVSAGDGAPRRIDVSELAVPERVDLSAWIGASSGLLDDTDLAEIVAAMAPDSIAAVIIYENLWVLELLDTFEAHGARLIADGGLAPADVVAALDATEH